MTTLNLSHLLFVIFFSIIGLKSQENCTLCDMNFIRQSQLDSFIIQYPYCEQVDNIKIYGLDINNIHALKNLNFISQLTIANTSIHSLKGLDSLRRSDYIVINNNDQLQDLKILNHLHFAKRISIVSNDALQTFEGLSGDSIMLIIVEGNRKIKNLKGLKSVFCKRLSIYNGNFESMSGHNLENLKILNLSNINTLDSLNFKNLDSIYIDLCPKIFSLKALDNLLSLNTIELYLNENLRECSTELICKKMSDASFNIRLALNSNGCNSKEEIIEKCITNTENEPALNQIEIYPHPITNGINIRGLMESMDYKIINMTGKIIQNGQTDNFIDVSNLPKGFYVLHLCSKRQKIRIKTLKMIKI